jgi:uncharacterized protein (TIGR00251 family)
LIGLEKSGESAIRFKVRVTPRSSKTSLTENPDIGFKLKVKSPPVEGAANKECIRYLAKTFHVPQNAVKLIRGGKSRDKVFELDGITLEEAISVLKQISQ